MADPIRFQNSNGFEKQGPFYRWLYRYLIQPFFNYLYPDWGISMLARTHSMMKSSIEKKTSHHAVESIYERKYAINDGDSLKRFFFRLWSNSLSVLGLQNRLALVTRSIQDEIKKRFESSPDKPIRVLCLASGSGRSVIDALHNLDQERALTGTVEVCFLDREEEALEYCRQYLKKSGISDHHMLHFDWCEDEVYRFLEIACLKSHYDIVELVGFLDYIEEPEIIRCLNMIYETLCTDGVLIAANILHNPEERAINRLLKWGLKHRYPEDLLSLFNQSQFGQLCSECIQILVEPLKVHAVILAQKSVVATG